MLGTQVCKRKMHCCTALMRAPPSVAHSLLAALPHHLPNKPVSCFIASGARFGGNAQFASRFTVRAMAQKPDLEAFGKAKSGTGSPSKERGDCPFSQSVYLELEEKGLPYTATYIQEGPDKPGWFTEKNPSGLMPVLRDGDFWLQDSQKIAQYLEEKYPEPSLKTPEEYTKVGEGLFPAFTAWLKTKNPEDPSKEEYVKQLQSLDEELKKHGPYIAGDKPTISDFALAPKLRHARVALEHFYGFRIPEEFKAVHNFVQKMESRPSFQKTDSPDALIIQGWQKKFELPDRMLKAQAA